MQNLPTVFRLSAILLTMFSVLPSCATVKKSRPTLPDAQRVQAQQTTFNGLILHTLSREMPHGGGYAGSPADVARLAEHGVVWNPEQQLLHIQPRATVPTFCSAACYMVLLRALQHWEIRRGLRLPIDAWKALDVYPDQHDGYGVWGRANANGPGFAKLVHDLGVGFNFNDISQAKPGDFLKIFWSPEIGANERGHLVIYLGTENKNGTLYLRYWSANKPGGFGTKSAPLSRMHNLIFTRITSPENFARAPHLPKQDAWLSNMQQQRFDFAEIRRACGVR